MSVRARSVFIAALLAAALVSTNAAAAWVTLKPVKKQTVDTPVPVFVRVHGRLHGGEVQLRYRPASGKDWQTLTMQPTGKGYGAVIPCDSVQGEAIVEYYVRIRRHGRTVAHKRSPKNPFAVAFVPSLEGAPPALPGQDPPGKCEKDEEPVIDLSSDEDSSSPSENEPPPEEHHSGKLRRLWIDIGIVQDVALLGGKDVCSPQGEENAFYCFRDDGQQYLGFPVMGQYDQIATGLALSATRVIAGLDYVLGKVTIGARLGFTLHGGSPTVEGGVSSLPLLASARLEYWFADHAYATEAFTPYLLAEGGLAEADSKHRVTLVEDTTKVSKQKNPAHQDLDAWKRMGRGYAGLGLGGFLPLSQSGGLAFELEGRLMFPANGFVIAPGAFYAASF